MRTKLITFVLLSAFLILGIASAASLTITPKTVPTSLSHNSASFTITFELNNTGSADTNVSFSKSSITAGTATISLADVAVIDGSTTTQSQTLTATITFPKNQAGSIAGNITADDSGSGTPKSFLFSIPITTSATLSVSKPTELSLTKQGQINITNTGNIALNNIDLTSAGTFNVTFSSDPVALSTPGSSTVINVSSTQLSSLKFGNNVVTITAKDTAQTAATATTSFTVQKTFCSNGSIGTNLTIEKIKINNKGEGKDEEWKRLDDITIEVKVENDGETDIKDVMVEIGLFDDNGVNQINDMEFENSDEEEFDLGKINDGKDDEALFEFKVPGDFEEGTYKLAIKVFSTDVKENFLCIDSTSELSDTIFEDISVEEEDDQGKFIALDNFRLSSSQATCGDSLSIDLDIFNVGEDDEEQVRINLVSKALGLDLFKEIKSDLDRGDDDSVSFTFLIPAGLEEKTYTLEFTSEYDFKSGVYREISDDTDRIPIDVFGCSVVLGSTGTTSGQSAAISASLQSDAKAGENLLVRTTITNLESSITGFVLDVKNIGSFATLNSISEKIITLNPGESREVIISLALKDSASGSESFTIEVLANGKLQTRQVAVNVASTGGLGGIGGGSTIWLIGAINLILIVLIILVAVRISRK